MTRIVEFTTPAGYRVRAQQCDRGCTTPSGFPQKRCAKCDPASATHTARFSKEQARTSSATSCGLALANPSPNCPSMACTAPSRCALMTSLACSSVRCFGSFMALALSFNGWLWSFHSRNAARAAPMIWPELAAQAKEVANV